MSRDLDRPVAEATSELRARAKAIAAGIAGLLLLSVLIAAEGVDGGGGVHPEPRARGELPPPTVAPVPRRVAHVKAHLRDRSDEKPDPTCINSFRPECGPLRWSRDPGPNEPLEVDVSISPSEPQIGDRIVVKVHAVDPDAPIDQIAVEFDLPKIGTAYMCRGRFGTWDPPERKRGEFRGRFTHIYSEPGEYSIDVWIDSGTWGCNDPYGNASIMRFPVVIPHKPDPSAGDEESRSILEALDDTICASDRCDIDPHPVADVITTRRPGQPLNMGAERATE